MTNPHEILICPSCGEVLSREEDMHGEVLPCHELDCLQFYEVDEIVEETTKRAPVQ